ncbi:MAG TPA: PfkB family carbohydrate kinase [Blastocatellia bacterium]|nr:PfkB family carbohydrate kinase [Blastocatellia bacterium]
MEFGIDIPINKPFDAVALGLNAVDHLIVVPYYPPFNSKTSFLSHTLAPGGQSATAMVTLARLGMRARYIGKVGADDMGRFQINSIAAEGVESSGIMVVEGAESQSAFIIIDSASGERTILWHRDERLIISEGEVDRATVTAGRALHLDGHDVAASIAAARYAREANVPTVLDIDQVYPGVEELLPLIDFMISSSSFPERVTGEADLSSALKKLSEQTGSLFVAATIGEEGVLAYFQGQYIHSPAFKIQCQDTTGAGDAFHGGFIYGLLAGFSVEQTLKFANAVAALKCRAVGARTSLPTLDEVNSFLEANSIA